MEELDSAAGCGQKISEMEVLGLQSRRLPYADGQEHGRQLFLGQKGVTLWRDWSHLFVYLSDIPLEDIDRTQMHLRTIRIYRFPYQ